MKQDWIRQCLLLAATPATFYSGARKIIRPVHFMMGPPKDDLYMPDIGFTRSKMTMLNRLYRVDESIEAAIPLWERRKQQDKYGSVGFHCYGHFVKSNIEKKSKRASVMGPCIQSVTLTYLPDRTTSVDCFYRTTELFKKFPADLVFLRDELLAEFDFNDAPISEINFHFANVTLHPMYWITLVPHFHDPIKILDQLKSKDPYFYKWTIRWTSRYILDEHAHGIQKFSQALRVAKNASESIDTRVLKKLQSYCNQNHPGYDRKTPESSIEEDPD